MTPDFRLTADGRDITAAIRDRLLSLTVADEMGEAADRLDFSLDNRDFLLAWPNSGATLACALGYRETGLIEMGRWQVVEVGFEHPAATLTFSAQAADMTAKIKEPRSKAWRDTSLGGIVQTIAARHGLTAKVASNLGGVAIKQVSQANESDLHFLTRLGRDYGATVKAADGKLLFLPAGGGQTAAGVALPPVRLTPTEVSRLSAVLASRDRYQSVAARWHSKGAAKEQVVVAGAGEPRYTLSRVYPQATAARAAAAAKLDALRRGAASVSLELPGRPEIGAGMPVELAGFPSGISGRWNVQQATHRLSTAGLSTSLALEAGA